MFSTGYEKNTHRGHLFFVCNFSLCSAETASLRSPPPSTPLSSFRMTRHLCWAMESHAIPGAHGEWRVMSDGSGESEARAHPTRHPHAILLPVRAAVLLKGNHSTQIHSDMKDSNIILYQSHRHSCIPKVCASSCFIMFKRGVELESLWCLIILFM